METKYGTTEWYQGKNNTTRTVLNGIPVQMNGVLFPGDVLNRAKIAAKKDTTYLGCGPIVMIGMADFFARYLGYTEISVNPYDDFYQEKLSTEILKNTVTWDVNTDNYGVQTFSLLGYCVDGFNSVMVTIYIIQSKPTLIGTSSDGLIPIWEPVQNKTNRELLKSKFLEYVAVNSSNTEYDNSKEIGNEYVYTFKRLSEREINDSGRFNHNIHDIINLDIDLNYGISVLSNWDLRLLQLHIQQI